MPSGNAAVPPGNAATPPDNAAVPPGNAVTPPHNDAVPPGNAATPPDNDAVPPGNAATPPDNAAMSVIQAILVDLATSPDRQVMFPVISSAAETILLLPVGTAGVDRSFSTLNRILSST